MAAGSVQQAPLMDPASRAGRIGDDYHIPDAGLAALLDDLWNCARRRGHNRQIDPAADAVHRSHAGLPKKLRVLGIDRPHFALEAAVQDVAQNHMADRPRLLGGTDNRHGLRFKQGLQVVGVRHDVGDSRYR